MATVAGGVFMLLVHSLTAKLDKAQYGEFVTLLRCLILLGIPTVGLQNVFAHQAASALNEEDKHRLSKTTRAVVVFVFAVWLVMAGIVFFSQDLILSKLQITSARALWMTMLIVLASLWLPIFKGILQGKQNFFGLGWVAILDGVGRFAAIAVIVLLLKWQAAGAMFGAFIGQLGGIFISAWLIRDVLKGVGAHFTWGPWLAKVGPLTLGFGAMLFLQTADVLFVQSVFSKEVSPFYMAAAMIGFALVQLTGPLVSVMFPKIVRSVARSEKSNAMLLTFWTTAAIGGAAALACTLFPELPLRILYWTKPEFLKSASIVPWFGWAMLFMMLANVLVGNLLAREKFKIVPWLVVLAVGYGVVLFNLRSSLSAMEPFLAFKRLIQVIGIFNIVLVGVALLFSRNIESPKK